MFWAGSYACSPGSPEPCAPCKLSQPCPRPLRCSRPLQRASNAWLITHRPLNAIFGASGGARSNDLANKVLQLALGSDMPAGVVCLSVFGADAEGRLFVVPLV